jgi:voltage-dependent anion channel protein 2
MAKPTLFKDIGKTSKDLLSRDFPTESFGFEVEAKAECAKYKVTATKKADGDLECLFEPTFTFAKQGVTAKTTFKNNKSYAAEIVLEDKLAKGLKLTINGDSSEKDKKAKTTVKGAVEYKHEKGTATVQVSYPVKAEKAQITANASVSANVAEKYLVGANVEYEIGASAPSQWSLRLQYTAPQFALLGYYDNTKSSEKSIVGVNYYHKVRSDVEFVTDVSVDTAAPDVKPKFHVGAAWKQSETSTFKFKLEAEEKKLTVAHLQKLSSDATLIVGLQCEVPAQHASSANNKVGANLKFNF